MLRSHEDEEKVADDTEEKLSELHSNIHHMERKIRITDSEKKADVEGSTTEIKKNDLEIKQLMMQVKELEVRIKSCQKADENFISKEFHKYNRNLGRMKGKSGREAVDLLDAEVLELNRKCKVFDHEQQLLRRTLKSNEQQLKEMTSKCSEDFENEPTEYDSLQRVRELENEQQKVNKNILECESMQNKFKTMKEQLQMNQLSYPALLLNVEKEFKSQQFNSEMLETGHSGITGPETCLHAEINDAGGDNTNSEDSDNQRNKGTSLQRENTSDPNKSMASDQQKELQEIRDAFEKIKEVTAVYDIQDAESRFLVQKSMCDDLHDLRKRLVKSLYELKMEKKQVDSRMALLRGISTEEPRRELDEELSVAKHRLEEQEKRKKDSKLDLDKMTSLLNEVEARQRQILELLESYFPEVVTSQELAVSDVTKKIEEVLMGKLK